MTSSQYWYFFTSVTFGYGGLMGRFFSLFAVCAICFTVLSGCASLTGNLFSPSVHAARYDDAGIKTSIGSALLKKDASRSNDINVHCFDGHVFLVGEADKEFRAEAIAIAQQTEGVVHVTTHWFPTGTASTSSDAAIEGEIDLGALFSKDEAPAVVDLDVWGGNVVLTGLADKQADIDKALAKIKRIPHVKSVTSYVTIAKDS